MNNGIFWTHAQAEKLREMYLNGKSFTEIAKRLGMSRNAIAGKIYRLGLKRDEPEDVA